MARNESRVSFGAKCLLHSVDFPSFEWMRLGGNFGILDSSNGPMFLLVEHSALLKLESNGGAFFRHITGWRESGLCHEPPISLVCLSRMATLVEGRARHHSSKCRKMSQIWMPLALIRCLLTYKQAAFARSTLKSLAYSAEIMNLNKRLQWRFRRCQIN